MVVGGQNARLPRGTPSLPRHVRVLLPRLASMSVPVTLGRTVSTGPVPLPLCCCCPLSLCTPRYPVPGPAYSSTGARVVSVPPAAIARVIREGV